LMRASMLMISFLIWPVVERSALTCLEKFRATACRIH
jgi:hypothetical protein